MFRDESSCNTYNYGDALYWDARYIQEADCGSFDWYQRYSALRPFIRKYISPTSTVLMVGCGNAVISEDMVKDGFEDIINIDISFVAIEMMKKKHEHVPQLKYMKMDVKDMSFFPDDSFDSVIDKDAPLSASQMLGEVSRLLKPGGVYMLITYGDPTVRMPHINKPVYNWEIELYIIRIRLDVLESAAFDYLLFARPGFQKRDESVSFDSYLEPVPTTDKGLLHPDYVMEDPESHFIYVCKKIDHSTDLSNKSTNHLTDDTMQR
ncbi:hypothetical protein BUALT_Bualt19G0044100 [Buddleja alternifolia]|uniref:Methyltransferase type 11 domain-containing protein n=1 Tax=Buddleja alternifolia TaxID=168488 RepID=A0AAV6W9G1_9LAMI|nr:hypothetical protein BUALT_Bualt19G0044100 [Buddleja alternifolia]